MPEPTNEEQIIARARQQVTERRQAALHDRWQRTTAYLIPVAAGLLIVLFFVWPAPLPDKLDFLVSGTNGRRVAHAYFVDGRMLPLEARTTGIYGGFLLAFGWLLLARPAGPTVAGLWRAQRLGSRAIATVVGIFFASMVFDGVNSTLITLDLPHLYTTTNLHRLITGLLSGIALAALLAWLLGYNALTPKPTDAPAYLTGTRGLIGLGGALLLCGGFAALVLTADPWSYYPIALIGVLGTIILLTGLALLPVLQLGGLRHQITQSSQLFVPTALAFLLGNGLLLLLAGLRWWLSTP